MSKVYTNISELSEIIPTLSVGDEVYLTGTLYTARDAAHKRLFALIEDKKALPFDLNGAVIYYSGPTPEMPGQVIGSCGPTTSSRMDVYTPLLMEKGLLATIGKGPRNAKVIQAIKDRCGIYFCAIGGAGALYAGCVKKYEVLAFDDLGCESIKKLTVENFPVLCAIDCLGNSIFEKGK